MSPRQRKINAKAAKRRVLEYLESRKQSYGQHMGIVGMYPVLKDKMIIHWIITIRFSDNDFRKFKVSRASGTVYPQ